MLKTITFDLETIYPEEYEGKDEFPPLPLHVPVVGSFLVCSEDKLEMVTHSMDTSDDAEKNMLDWLQSELSVPAGKPMQRTRLVSWNGFKFDLPLLLIRAMHHGLDLSGLSGFRHRYHDTHFDMKFRIANGETRNYSLDNTAKALGLVGKHVCSGGDVQKLWKYEQRYDQVRRYCEEDVLQTHMIYLKWMRTFHGAKSVAPRLQQCDQMLRERMLKDIEEAQCASRIEKDTPSNLSQS